MDTLAMAVGYIFMATAAALAAAGAMVFGVVQVSIWVARTGKEVGGIAEFVRWKRSMAKTRPYVDRL